MVLSGTHGYVLNSKLPLLTMWQGDKLINPIAGVLCRQFHKDSGKVG